MTEQRTERIECAAIQYTLYNGEVGIVDGAHHSDCLGWLTAAGFSVRVRDASKDTYGFLTSTGRFVGRAEACKIAKAAGQYTGSHKLLSSDDLW